MLFRMCEKKLKDVELYIAYDQSFNDIFKTLDDHNVLECDSAPCSQDCSSTRGLFEKGDHDFILFLIDKLKNRDYEDILKSTSFECMLQRYHYHTEEPSCADSCITNQAITDYLANNVYSKQLHVLLCGVASLQLFVQYNWTGPRKENSCYLEFISKIFFQKDCFNLKTVLNNLSFDGETVYRKLYLPELLLLSKILLYDTGDWLNLCASYKIWRLRYLMIYQQVISGKNLTIYAKIQNLIEEISGLEFIKERNQLARIYFYTEAGLAFLYHSEISKAKSYFLEAQTSVGIDVNLSGALGKRTHFQQTAFAQLILTVKRKTQIGGKLDYNEHVYAEFPEDVQLQDDTIMNKIKFLNENEDVLSNLYPEEQIVISGLASLVQKSNAVQDLVSEELQAFITSLISQPKVWCIHLKSLALRCQLEKSSSRRIERAMMQMQALVDSIAKSTPDASQRLFLFYCTQPSPHWIFEKELAYLLFSLGATKAALEVFTRLELWEDVVVCYQRLQRKDKAEAIIRKQLEIEENPILWCLLGDCTDDPQFYFRAWELSGCRSARAQHSLGYLYFSKKDYKECIPFFLKSLEINSLQLKVWFSLAYAASQIDDFELAAKAYRTIVNIDPDSFEAWNNLSNAYIKMKQKHRAWKTLQEALKCNYEEWRIWENYLLVCVDVGAFEDALNACHRLLDIKGKYTDEEVLSILAKAVNEEIHDITGRSASYLREKVLELFGRITSIVPNNSEIWKLYASILASDPSNLTNKEAMERIIQYLQKAHRYATHMQKWESDINTCKNVVQNAVKLVEVCLNYANLPSTSGPPLVQILNSVRLLLKSLIATLTKQSNNSNSVQNLEYNSFIEVLENKLENIMSASVISA